MEHTLFECPTVCGPDPLYKAIRNNDEFCLHRAVRKQCEEMYQNCHSYLDSDFQKEFQRNFHHRWFEMFLISSLREAGIEPEEKGNDEGPDVKLIIGTQTIWIEAVCVGPGDNEKTDSLHPYPEINSPAILSVPHKEMILRFRSSLQEKADKFKKYRHNGLVKEEDLTVVAINFNFNFEKSHGNYPNSFLHLPKVVMCSVYGKAIETDSNVRTIEKSNGATVDVRCFVDKCMNHVSALLATSADVINTSKFLNEVADAYKEFFFFRNLGTDTNNKWPRKLYPLWKEFWFKESSNDWFLKHPCDSELLKFMKLNNLSYLLPNKGTLVSKKI